MSIAQSDPCFLENLKPLKGVGEDGGDGHGDDGRISPEHPSPILHAPRDNISRKGKSLTRILTCVLHSASIVFPTEALNNTPR